MPRTNGLAVVLFFCLFFIHPAFAQTQSEKTKTVDQQLDLIESSQHNEKTFQGVSCIRSGDIEKEFNSPQVDAQKEFLYLQVNTDKEFLYLPVDEQKEFPYLPVDAQKEFSSSCCNR